MDVEAVTDDKSFVKADGTESFPQACAVATGWMFDFLFVCLCRHFKDGKLDEFNKCIETFKTLSQSSSLIDKEKHYDEKTLICGFLSRVLYGKHLDVFFEEDESVLPLMSAFQTWSCLEKTVQDESLFKNISTLLLVQSVDVCLKKGKRNSASSVLKWIKNIDECPQKLQVKLSTIVAQRDTYNHFLMSYSFSCLLDTICTFLDDYLKRNPSDYLLKAATDVVVSSDDMKHLDDVKSEDDLSSETTNQTPDSSKKNERKKRKLFSTKITDMWKPESCKKLTIPVRKMAAKELPNHTLNTSRDTVDGQKKRKPRQKWTYQLDRYLKDGVKRHGVGKWGHILQDYDFEGRTSVMLKDRWRVLKKGYLAD
ncbi:telomeric repeat-binding factor 1 [Gouania willdenowi]|uniref:Telomeric repeat-binding factor n=1 Tax=Gouania willdenowi TaxID=441366 RepID=A0A8C5I0F0_GOUWI|nr:telomeric repeat-binding factor 1 [Gouania willdenowi]